MCIYRWYWAFISKLTTQRLSQWITRKIIESTDESTNHLICRVCRWISAEMMNWWVSEFCCLFVNVLVGQSVSPSVSPSVSQSVSQSVGQSRSQIFRIKCSRIFHLDLWHFKIFYNLFFYTHSKYKISKLIFIDISLKFNLNKKNIQSYHS